MYQCKSSRYGYSYDGVKFELLTFEDTHFLIPWSHSNSSQFFSLAPSLVTVTRHTNYASSFDVLLMF